VFSEGVFFSIVFMLKAKQKQKRKERARNIVFYPRQAVKNDSVGLTNASLA
jgi:hypothetical protein